MSRTGRCAHRSGASPGRPRLVTGGHSTDGEDSPAAASEETANRHLPRMAMLLLSRQRAARSVLTAQFKACSRAKPGAACGRSPILWWIALVVLVIWLIGFAVRMGQGTSRGRWYRW